MPTVGLLYPGHSAEDDFPALEERISGAVRLPVVITSVGEDAHRVVRIDDHVNAIDVLHHARAGVPTA